MKAILKSILPLTAVLMFACCKQPCPPCPPAQSNCLGIDTVLRSDVENFLLDSISESKFEFAGGFIKASTLRQLLDTLQTDTVFIAIGVTSRGNEIDMAGKNGKNGSAPMNTMNTKPCYMCLPQPPCCPADTVFYPEL